LQNLARRARSAGFDGFAPPMPVSSTGMHPGARLSLHQDRNEQDFGAPIVSVCSGCRRSSCLAGQRRSDTPRLVRWPRRWWSSGVDPRELRYHGVLAIKDGLTRPGQTPHQPDTAPGTLIHWRCAANERNEVTNVDRRHTPQTHSTGRGWRSRRLTPACPRRSLLEPASQATGPSATSSRT